MTVKTPVRPGAGSVVRTPKPAVGPKVQPTEPLDFPKRFRDPNQAAKWARKKAMQRGMPRREAEAIDEHCFCKTREYAVRQYCQFLDIDPWHVLSRIGSRRR